VWRRAAGPQVLRYLPVTKIEACTPRSAIRPVDAVTAAGRQIVLAAVTVFHVGMRAAIVSPPGVTGVRQAAALITVPRDVCATMSNRNGVAMVLRICMVVDVTTGSRLRQAARQAGPRQPPFVKEKGTRMGTGGNGNGVAQWR